MVRPHGFNKDAARQKFRSEFMGGSRTMTMNGWRPALRHIADDVAGAWPSASARSVDLMQNVAWIAGAIDQAVVNTVGTGLRLNAMPDPEALGVDEREASRLAKKIERRFRTYASNPYECDIEGRRNLGQMGGAWMRSYFAFGEGVATLPWRERSGGMNGTKVRLVPAYRLSQLTDKFNRLVQGVRMDEDGFPVAYVFDVPERMTGTMHVEMRARDALGRPNVIHAFDGMPGQVRGITPLVAALSVARQFDQISNATLMNMLIQSVFAASVTSDMPTEDAMTGLLTPKEQAEMAKQGLSSYDAWFEAQSAWHERSSINVGVGGRVAHMFPGQKMEFLTSEGPAQSYKDFATSLLREMARAIGITYEAMTGDYAGVTFSSVRMAVDEIFRIVMYRRQNIAAPFFQGVYEAWLEEEIDRGRIVIQGGLSTFMANRSAICRAEWRGTPKPQTNDGQATQAYERLYRLGIITASQISSEIGLDYEDTVAELKREEEMRREAGLPDPIFQGVAADAGKAPPSEDATDTSEGGKPDEGGGDNAG